MRTVHRLAFAAAAALVACSSPPSKVPAPAQPMPPHARELAADTPLVTRGGAAFEAPKGWWLTQGDGILLEDPERTLKAWIVETPEADPVRAIAGAWRRVRPDFASAIDGEPDVPPPADGWDAIANVGYTGTDERVVSA